MVMQAVSFHACTISSAFLGCKARAWRWLLWQTATHLNLLLGLQQWRHLPHLEQELWLGGHHKNQTLQSGCALVAQKEGQLPLAALEAHLHPNLQGGTLGLFQ